MDFDSEDYHRFVAAAAEDCYCCLDCGSDVPCAGVLAGGFCDTRCHCDERGVHDDELLELGGEGGCA